MSPSSEHADPKASAQRRSIRRRGGWAPFVALGLSLLATAATAKFVAETTSELDQLHFEDASTAVARSIAERMRTYRVALDAGVALFAAAADEIDAGRFRAFVQWFDVEQRHPGIQGYGFTATVTSEQLEDLRARLHSEGYQDFRVWPEGERSVYQPVTYLFPEDARNRAALGYDMASEETRAEAMRRARDTGEPALSGPVVLVQEIDEDVQQGLLMYAPVYGGPGAVDSVASVEERRGALQGFVYAPFRATDLFEAIFARQPSPYVTFSVYDGSPDDGHLLYRASDWEDSAHGSDLRLERTLQVAGRDWTLVFRPTGAFVEASETFLLPLTIASGIAISIALFFLVGLETRARARAIRSAMELQHSERRLRQANRAKDEFLAMLGHELRNPLAATRSALEVLRLSDIRDGEALEALLAAERQMLRQKHLVDDLLDMSRVNRGKIALRREVLDLRTAVSEAVATVRGDATRREQDLKLSLPPDVVPVDGDSTRLVQVIQNLLTNAIKYTPDGGRITVTCHVEDGEAMVRVRDTGIGIAAPELDRIFDLFAQVDTSLARSAGGLGIGLTLSRRLMAMHGGTLEAHSEGRNLGSEFVVRLPTVEWKPIRAPSSYSGREPASQPPSLCVLVVEDNEDTRALSESLLRKWGYDVLTAEDGERGVEVALERRPDIALVDIGLPRMDGFEVAARIRSHVPAEEMTLVAVSGYGREEDLRRSAESGFDRHLTKPVEPHALRSLLREVQRGLAHPPETEEPPHDSATG